MKDLNKQFAGVHEEFVRVLQGVSSLYRFGSDRINNAEEYCLRHSKAMASFNSTELHPDTCEHYRRLAATKGEA